MAEALTTFLIAMTPVVELRGAIPYGVLSGLNIWDAYIIATIGNLLPIPFIIVFERKIFAWLKGKSTILKRFVEWIEARAGRHRSLIGSYEFWGLILLVAIPIPGTGAWTGALVAAMTNLRLKRAMPAITIGVILAGLIVSVLTVGIGAML